MESVRVSRLRVYPVKGAGGSDLEVMHLDPLGPRFDRRWMVTTPGGDFVSQRQAPRLATVRPSVGEDALVLRAPGQPSLTLAFRERGPAARVRVWGVELTVRSVFPAADTWMSEVLGGDYRLVFMPDDVERLTDPAYAEGHRISFADGYPALLVGEGSVRELARRAGRHIPVERFRPNIVARGTRPHEEDRWRRVTIGGLGFSGVKLCARCKVTTVDQERGTQDPDSEPLRTLARYRRIEAHVYFGLNAVHHDRGRIALGDEVKVVERGVVPGAWR